MVSVDFGAVALIVFLIFSNISWISSGNEAMYSSIVAKCFLIFS